MVGSSTQYSFVFYCRFLSVSERDEEIESDKPVEKEIRDKNKNSKRNRVKEWKYDTIKYYLLQYIIHTCSSFAQK